LPPTVSAIRARGRGAPTIRGPPYAPTPDRNGRSVRGPAFDNVSVANSKNWLDTVGPLVTFINIYNDFSAVHSSVYRRSTDPANALRGGHFLLIIGYDDSLGAWLCKNSWGTGWGVNGIGWIAYGQCNIDDYGRYGLHNVNPDPWTKRRLHNGNLFESGNGTLHRNLEVVGSNGARVQHRWREGGPPWNWGAAAAFGNDGRGVPDPRRHHLQPQHGADLHHHRRAPPPLVDRRRRVRPVDRRRRLRPDRL